MTTLNRDNIEEWCDEVCDCGCQDHEEKERCNCKEECHCNEEGHECHCGEGSGCGQHCTCGDECHCHEGDRCSEECTCENVEEVVDDKAQMYLALAKQIQADFDNYRRHAVEDKNKARVFGQISIIEVFLPCLDTFKEAKKSITDENVLKGVEMIENKILDALEQVGVSKMETIGQKFDHNLHEAIAQFRDESKENDVILDEYQAGYTFNDKVIRYAKVIVNKRED